MDCPAEAKPRQKRPAQHLYRTKMGTGAGYYDLFTVQKKKERALPSVLPSWYDVILLCVLEVCTHLLALCKRGTTLAELVGKLRIAVGRCSDFFHRNYIRLKGCKCILVVISEITVYCSILGGTLYFCIYFSSIIYFTIYFRGRDILH